MDDFDEKRFHVALPVFPLPDAVLFPRAVLPLHVFEPRYRKMMLDLVAQSPGQRMLAIALLRGNYESLYHTNRAPIWPTVCVGEVVRNHQRADGCFDIVVVGRARARITLEDCAGTYRKAKLKFIPTEPIDMMAAVHPALDSVRALLSDIADLGLHDRDHIQRVINESPTAAALIDIGTFHLVGSHCAQVKQRILEEHRLEVRAEILAMQLRSILDNWRVAQVTQRLGPQWPQLPNLN